MPHKLLAILVFALTSYSCQAQPTDCSIENMSADLEDRYDKDQEIRNEFMPLLAAYQEDGSGKIKLLSKAMRMERIDQKNQRALTAYLTECGWPNELSPKAHRAIYMILQHSDSLLVKNYLPQVKKRVEEGYLEPDDWATMYDRLCMWEMRPQRYGTQTFEGKELVNWVWPVEEVATLQARRDSVGLPSMEAYIQLAKDSMGVVMKWDPGMTVEEAIRKKRTR